MKLRTRYRLRQAFTFGLTFVSYALYHAGRQPAGTAKAGLNPNSSNSTAVNATDFQYLAYDQLSWTNQSLYGMYNESSNQSNDFQADIHSGWSPFDDPVHGGYWLSLLDTLFLAGYAAGMLFAGPLGDRLPLNRFIAAGMLGAGSLLVLNGSFFFMNVHNVALWGIVNFCGGIFQSSGWPSNVTVMTRWFAQGQLGSILGIWSAQQPVGNIIGKQLGAGLQAAYGWPFNFIGLGSLLCVGALSMLFLLYNSPDQLFTADEMKQIRSGVHDEEKESLLEEQYQMPNDRRKLSDEDYLIGQSINQPHNLPIAVHSPFMGEHFDEKGNPDDQSINQLNNQSSEEPIEYPHLSFWQCLMIPGVIEFGFSLFFSKFLNYSLMFWLPYYLTKSLSYAPETASTISTAFDYGGMLGGVLAGVISDWNGKRGCTSFMMCLMCIPLLWLYELFGDAGWVANVALLFIVGVFVNGPFSLISSAVCSDLGTHPILNGNPHGMSTVTGIIDTFGSVGATFTGVVVASVASGLGWTAVFYSLMIVCILCSVSILRVVKHELFGEKGVVYGAQSNLKRAVSDVSVMAESDEDDEEQQIKILHQDVKLRV